MTSRPEHVDLRPERRSRVLHDLEDWLETPMLVLSFLWLVLVVVELVWGETRTLEVFGTAIWVVFLSEFGLRLTLAPKKGAFLRQNILTAIALVAPAFRLLRVLRFLRFARATRGLRLIRVVGTANRTMNALRASFSRRGLGYVLGLTITVALLGAGGMLAFEPASQSNGGFPSYGDALWWTAMLLASIGTDFWPKSAEGRILSFLLALYGFAVFGYITAAFASFFVERDATAPKSPSSSDVTNLRAEVAALRVELASTAVAAGRR